MDSIPDQERARVVLAATLAEPALRLVKEALGRLTAAEAMLEALAGAVDDPRR
jgi:hypothetical protein